MKCQIFMQGPEVVKAIKEYCVKNGFLEKDLGEVWFDMGVIKDRSINVTVERFN